MKVFVLFVWGTIKLAFFVAVLLGIARVFTISKDVAEIKRTLAEGERKRAD
ncbi:MAG: hypothetical protein ABIH26_08780 [Candidatus Eisenbacteria bacterium]